MIGVKDTGRISSPYSPFPYDLFVAGEFKDILNNMIARSKIAKIFKPRLYQYADYVLVKLYAYLTGKSTHHASEHLNTMLVRRVQLLKKKKIKRFKDDKRKRRLVPHQTDVDKFFRICAENEITIHNIFGNVLTALAVMIMKKYNPSMETYCVVDNTEIPYFGDATDDTVIGTHRKHMGTDKCHLVQGLGVKGSGMFLFTSIRLMRMKQYRAKHIPEDIKWLIFNDMVIKAMLADREFYRATLLRELKDKKINFLIPIKKFPRTKAYLERFLLGKGDLVSQYFMQHNGAKSGNPTGVLMYLVIIGKNEESAFDIRDAYRSGKLSYKEALERLSGFFTNMKPWKNVKKWALWLTKVYKKRWHGETGFADINAWRIPFKHHTGERALIDQYLIAIIYNLWQAFKKAQTLSNAFARDRTKKVFSDFLADKLEWGLQSEIIARFSLIPFKKMEVYFQR